MPVVEKDQLTQLIVPSQNLPLCPQKRF